MRSKMGFLKTISLAVFCISIAFPAMADDSYATVGMDQEWNWTGSGASIAINASLTNPSIPADYAFAATDGITTLKFFSGTVLTSGYASVAGSISFSVDGSTATVKNYRGDTVGTLDVSSGFKFLFIAGTTPDMTYDLYTHSTISNSYQLVADNNFTVDVSSITGNLQASAVPIPGSALLLGSSLLGLVGISTRKKKA